ncbi:SCO4402 family protein [Micromonospora sp. 067-2]|uniref:SCO4402 family protein n=1 Tax=Micromonospora sp. 067-2 TaxID=2789270 RepID=UPI00397A1473
MEELVILGKAMTEIRFPDMRNEIVRAVKALADPAYQWSAWIRRELPPGEYDEFTHRIHILYDDTEVLEDPDAAIGIYLRSQEEADSMRTLAQAIDSLFDECGTHLSDEAYLRASGWPAVVQAANAALSSLES